MDFQGKKFKYGEKTAVYSVKLPISLLKQIKNDKIDVGKLIVESLQEAYNWRYYQRSN